MAFKRFIPLALFLLCFTGWSAWALGEAAFTLSGVVHDGSGGRIPHAHVTMRLAGAQTGPADV